MNIEQARFNMIEQQIRPWDVLDPAVLSLLTVVKREDFVPAAYRSLAFVDTEVPLPAGQCMLAPRVEARMLQEINVHKHERVLEVGAGSGYMAALLAHRAQHVTTLEIVPELAQLAAANLKRAAVLNAAVRQGDGSRGLPAEAPFDAIILTAAGEWVPAELLAQLAPQGVVLGPFGPPEQQRLLRLRRDATGELQREDLGAVSFVPLLAGAR